MYDFINMAVLPQVIVLSIGIPALFLVFFVRRGREASSSGVDSHKAHQTAMTSREKMRMGLLRRKSRIPTIVQLGQAGAIEALRPYWNSKDEDERYFSLYYSACSTCDIALQEQLCLAILSASFRSERKTEMLRALHLSNTLLQDYADRTEGSQRADVIRSLNGEQLTPDELERLLQLQKQDPTIRHATLACLVDSSLEQALFHIRQSAVFETDPALREWIARRLAERKDVASRRLLGIMLEDPVLSVRESAMESMAAHGEEGAKFMRHMAAGDFSQNRQLARRYLSLKGL